MGYWDSSVSDNGRFPHVCLITVRFPYLLSESLRAERLEQLCPPDFALLLHLSDPIIVITFLVSLPTTGQVSSHHFASTWYTAGTSANNL